MIHDGGIGIDLARDLGSGRHDHDVVIRRDVVDYVESRPVCLRVEAEASPIAVPVQSRAVGRI